MIVTFNSRFQSRILIYLPMLVFSCLILSVEFTFDFSMIAKLTKEPKPKKLKEGQIEKPRTPASRSDIKQALRIKCNSVINSSRKKVLLSESIKSGLCFLLKGVIACQQALQVTHIFFLMSLRKLKKRGQKLLTVLSTVDHLKYNILILNFICVSVQS